MEFDVGRPQYFVHFCPFEHETIRFLVGDHLYPQYIHTKVISWFIPTNKYS